MTLNGSSNNQDFAVKSVYSFPKEFKPAEDLYSRAANAQKQPDVTLNSLNGYGGEKLVSISYMAENLKGGEQFSFF